MQETWTVGQLILEAEYWDRQSDKQHIAPELRAEYARTAQHYRQRAERLEQQDT